MRRRLLARTLTAALAGTLAAAVLATAGQAAPDEATRTAAAIARATAGMTQPVDGAGIPTQADQPVTITGAAGTIGIGLPASATAGTAVRTGTGTVVYPDARSAVNVAVQTLPDGGARALVAITDASAPREYRFPMTLPAGAGMVPAPDGGVDILAGDMLVGRIDAPWATDTTGRTLPTRYRVQGTTLVQDVDHRGATYPVVADPSVSTSWWGITLHLSQPETALLIDALNGGAGTTGIIAALSKGTFAKTIPGPLFYTIVAGSAAIGGVVLSRCSRGSGVDMRYTWNGIFVGCSRR